MMTLGSIFRPTFKIASSLRQIKYNAFHTGDVRNYAVQPCDNIPYVDLYENDPKTVVNIRDLCSGKKVVLFGVPGAFTSVCHKSQLPGYISKADALKRLGVDEIVCVSVNDPYVMAAWGRALNADGKVRMLADTCGCFTQAMGLGIDIPDLGGLRSKRYSMVIQNAIILTVAVEPDVTKLTVSSADNIKV